MEMKQTAIINDSAAKSSSSSAARQSVPQSSPLHELPFRPLDRLHSTAGNRATGRWLQAKLKIGSANDSYEQEADRVAAVVVGTSSIPATEVSSGTPSLMQRKSNAEEVETQEPNTAPISNNSHQGKCACEEDEFHLQRKLSDASPLVDQGPSVLMQRQRAGDQEVVSAGGECEDDREAIIHRKETLPAKSDDAPAIVHKVIRSAGQPLEPSLRTFFETRLNTNLEGVRVHTDSQAARSAEAVNARAYTVGEHVVFGQSQFSPESGSGKLLLAHELTHVLQQGNRGSPRSANQDRISEG